MLSFKLDNNFFVPIVCYKTVDLNSEKQHNRKITSLLADEKSRGDNN